MANNSRGSCLGLALLFCSLLATEAFVAKSRVAFAATTPRGDLPSLCSLSSLNFADDTSAVSSSSMAVADGIDIVKNILIGVGGIVAVILLITVVFSTYLIPEAAKQLERQAKEVDPALWNEYESKLEPGETIAMRPELMQELGNKVLAKYEMKETKKAATNDEANANPSPPGVVDVEVASKEDKDKDS
jgi:hypothetical protein